MVAGDLDGCVGSCWHGNHTVKMNYKIVLKRGGLILLSIVLYAAIAFMALCYITSPTISGGSILQ